MSWTLRCVLAVQCCPLQHDLLAGRDGDGVCLLGLFTFEPFASHLTTYQTSKGLSDFVYAGRDGGRLCRFIRAFQ
jgi:hypothetical protein